MQGHIYSLSLKVEADGIKNFPTSWSLNCFVRATTIVDAVARAEHALVAEGFHVDDARSCVRLDLDTYEPPPAHPAVEELQALADQGDYVLGGGTLQRYKRLSEAPAHDSDAALARRLLLAAKVYKPPVILSGGDVPKPR